VTLFAIRLFGLGESFKVSVTIIDCSNATHYNVFSFHHLSINCEVSGRPLKTESWVDQSLGGCCWPGHPPFNYGRPTFDDEETSRRA
jgi:hypothetical protein